MNTKDRILETALSMFSEHGYDPVSIRDICGAVGIKESTVYYHFKNKQDILDSLFIRFTVEGITFTGCLESQPKPVLWMD